MCGNCSDASKPFECTPAEPCSPPSAGTSESSDWPLIEWADDGVKWAGP